MKFTLDNRELAEGFFEDSRLIGIMAPFKDYQFCWMINNHLGMDFRINNELEIPLRRKGRTYFFSIYEFFEDANCLRHYLYNNKHDGEYLLPEFKHLDFLWLMKDDLVTDQMFTHLVDSLKKINGVQLVAELTYEKIRHKDHLIF